MTAARVAQCPGLSGLIAAASLMLANPVRAEEFECVIEPAIVVEIASPVGGLINEIHVARGDFVSRGQEIARLDSGIEATTVALMREQAGSQAEIASYQARLTLAQSRVERLRTLVARNISPQEELDEAEATVDVASREVSMAEMRHRIAQLELERAEAVLQQRIVVSPVNGLVLERMLYVGEFADPSIPVVRIAQLDPLLVEAFLPVEMFPTLQRGITATVRPSAPFTGIYEGRLTVIDQVFDAASSTFGVQVEIDNADLAIPAGHRCVLSFVAPG